MKAIDEFYILSHDEKIETISGVFSVLNEHLDDLYLEIYKSLIRKEEGSIQLCANLTLRLNSLGEGIGQKMHSIQKEILKGRNTKSEDTAGMH